MFLVRKAAKRRAASVIRNTKENCAKHASNNYPLRIHFQRRLSSLQTDIFADWPRHHPEIISSKF